MKHSVKITVLTEGDVRELNDHAAALLKMVDGMADLLNKAFFDLPFDTPTSKDIRGYLDKYPRTTAFKLGNEVKKKLTERVLEKEIEVGFSVEI